jgi:hypothetical protein
MAMCPSYFIILLCLTPENFTLQVESSATQWVKLKVYLEFLHIYISKIGIHLHVPELMSEVQKLMFQTEFSGIK